MGRCQTELPLLLQQPAMGWAMATPRTAPSTRDPVKVPTRLQKPPTMLLLGLMLALLAVSAGAVPLQKASEVQLAQVVSYFMRFGHTNHTQLQQADKVGALNILSNDIKRFQKFAGLTETGELDTATQKKLREPRCGVSDNAGRAFRKTGRRKRWTLHGSRWTTRLLKYSINNSPTSVGVQKATDDLLEDALNTWAREANIDFKKVPKRTRGSHIEIKFATGAHGDGDPFDNKGGTLAHAFFPIYGGDAHFDDKESWSINSRRGSNLYVAATHEFGHSLGLAHSQINSMMSPWYQKPTNPASRSLLAQDDIDAIRQLYGKRKKGTGPKIKAPGPEIRPKGGAGTQRRWRRPQPRYPQPTNPQPRYPQPRYPQPRYPQPRYPQREQGGYYPQPRQEPQRPQRPQQPTYFSWGSLGFNSLPRQVGFIAENKTKLNGDDILCANSKLDAALNDVDTMYVFQGRNYWRLTETGVASGYPRSISSGWGGIPSPIDAALYSNASDRIYMFKGDKVWTFTENYTIEPGYPKLISVVFPGMADRDLSAAFEWGKDGLIYMMKGGQYWKQGTRGPRPLSQWSGLPATIDAATQYSNGKTYFFSGQNYYRFDDGKFQVDDRDDIPFPRNSGKFWFLCKR